MAEAEARVYRRTIDSDNIRRLRKLAADKGQPESVVLNRLVRDGLECQERAADLDKRGGGPFETWSRSRPPGRASWRTFREMIEDMRAFAMGKDPGHGTLNGEGRDVPAIVYLLGCLASLVARPADAEGRGE